MPRIRYAAVVGTQRIQLGVATGDWAVKHRRELDHICRPTNRPGNVAVGEPVRNRAFATVVTVVLLAVALLAGAARARPCGTVVIPNDIGQTDPSPVTSINPLLGPTTANLQATLLLFRPLIWIGPDDQPDETRSLAQSVTALDGNRRMRVVLKDWRWSDGVPVLAADVRFTWERISALGDLYAYYGQGGIPDRVEAVREIDTHTVDFVLNRATNPAWFTLNALSQFAALPRHAWGDIGRNEMWQRQTDPAIARVVDGPFLLQELALDRYAIFVPNPAYSGPPARVARLVVSFQLNGALLSLQAKSVDMAHVPTPLWELARRLPEFYSVALPEPFGYMGLYFNYRDDAVSFFRDVRVRRALTEAADQKTIIALVYHGFAHENRAPVPVVPDSWESPALKSSGSPISYDPGRAAAELQAAGYMTDADGVREKNGVKLRFTVAASAETPERAQLLQILQQDLRGIGVDMHIRLLSFHQLDVTMRDPARWEALLIGGSLLGVPDGKQLESDNPGLNDQHLNDLVDASIDQPGRQGLYAYEEYAAATQPVNILPQEGFPLLVANRVGGVESFVNPTGFWAPEELWVRDAACSTAGSGAVR